MIECPKLTNINHNAVHKTNHAVEAKRKTHAHNHTHSQARTIIHTHSHTYTNKQTVRPIVRLLARSLAERRASNQVTMNSLIAEKQSSFLLKNEIYFLFCYNYCCWCWWCCWYLYAHSIDIEWYFLWSFGWNLY